MAREAGGRTGNTLFLNVSNSTGYLCRKPTPEEMSNYEKLTSEEKKNSPIKPVETKQGTVYHYNYLGTDYGYIEDICEEEVKHDNGVFKVLKIKLRTDSGIEEVSLSSRVKGGGLTAIFKNIITLLPNIDRNTKYSISTRKSEYNKKDGTKGHNINVFFNYSTPGKVNNAGREEDFVRSKLTWTSPKTPNGDIPAPEQEDVMGELQWSYKKQDTYLYSEFKKYRDLILAKELPAPSNNEQATNKVEKPPVAPVVSGAGSDEEDDLPF